MNTRPDSALTNEITPVGVPLAATIGTITTERMPRPRTSSSCSGSSTASVEQLVGDLRHQLRPAVAQHLRRAAVVARVGRVLLGELARELDLRRVAVDDRDLADRAGRSGMLTPHQSASSGTARPATSRSVCS